MYGIIDVGSGTSSGGVAPMNVKNIKAKAGNGKVTLTWQDPDDTIVEGETLCAWAGTKVIQKIGSCPQSIYDGTLIIDNKVRNTYENTGFEINNLVNGQIYYYAFFPYSDKGIQNKKVEENSTTATPTATRIYGIKRSLTSSSSVCERLEDAIGKIANATKNGGEVQNDFDNLYPWSDIISYNYDAKNEEIKAYYGDATFKFDGSNGDVFTKIPEFWWKRYQDTEYEYIYIATGELEGYTKSEEFSVGRYSASGSSTELFSKSGVAPLRSTTRANFRTYAKKKGNNIGLMDWRYYLLQMLYLVEYANTNSQNMLGYGICSASGVQNSGGCNSLGMKSGCISNDKKHSMIYRGIEDIYGNIFQWIDGLNIKSYKTYICYDPSKYVDDVFSGDYKAIGYTQSSLDGYVSKLGYDVNHPLVAMPTQASGSDSTYLCDYYWQNSGNRIVCVGGHYNYDMTCGLWFWSCYYTSSVANSYIGSRLLRY